MNFDLAPEHEAFRASVRELAQGVAEPLAAEVDRDHRFPEEAVAASHGRILGPAGVEGPYRAVGPDGGLVGIYRDDGAKAVPEVILA